jgi:hypothetical protein
VPKEVSYSLLVEKIENSRKKITANYYRHIKTNRLYFVEKLVLNESDLNVLVVYRHRNYSYISWVRPLSEFLEKFEPYVE